MYAVFDIKGRQERGSIGQVLRVDRLSGEVGQMLEFDNVLLLKDEDGIRVGSPSLAGAKVVVEVLGHGRGKKILVFKCKRRKKYRRKAGHRQEFTRVKVVDVQAP